MPESNNHKEYYAVIRGFLITEPAIFSSWGDVHPLINGFPKANFRGFKTLDEAKKYMDKEKVKSYWLELKDGHGKTKPEKIGVAYYAVANGHKPGIRTYYRGHGGAEPEVRQFPGACHKRFRTKAQAEAFIQDWKKMSARVAKATSKQASSDGRRPLNTQEGSLQVEPSSENSDVDGDALVGGMSQIRLVDSQ